MKKKQSPLLTVGILMLFLSPISAFAITLKSAERVNQFRPAEQDIVIAENSGRASETQENEISWSSGTNAAGNHTAIKEVRVGEISNPNGGYLRVRLVPTWVDESGCVVSGVEDVTDIGDAKLSGNTLLFKNSGGTENVIVLNLDEDWADKWKAVTDGNENGSVLYFESLSPLKSSDKEKKLVSSVEISDEILQKANNNKIFLRLDVLADAIQLSGDPKTDRNWAE